MNQKRKTKEEDVSYSEFFIYTYFFVSKFSGKLVSLTTKLYPFSTFWRTNLLHDRNKDIRQAMDLIDLTSSISRTRFDIYFYSKDENFIYIEGKLMSKNYNKFLHNLNLTFKGVDFYVRDKDNGNKMISLLREQFIRSDLYNIFPWN